jgi:hypothetical protein
LEIQGQYNIDLPWHASVCENTLQLTFFLTSLDSKAVIRIELPEYFLNAQEH